MPDGNVSFHRRSVDTFPDWASSKSLLRRCKIDSSAKGTIEDAKRYPEEEILEVDFANRVIGGGVIGHVGNTFQFTLGMRTRRSESSRFLNDIQIRFLISPELIISRLFTSPLEDNECLIINGPERYSLYE